MKQNDKKSKSGLYLCASAGNGTENVARVEPLLKSGSVACLLIVPPEGGKIDPGDGLALVEVAKAHSIPALVSDDPQLARTLRADGVHLSWRDGIVDDFNEAREIVGGGAIVGADAGRSRHTAMLLGEANADYVAFGIPSFVRDIEKARARQLELVRWWSEIFEIQSVAFAGADLEHAKMLASCGADFVACDLPVTLPTADLKDWLDSCLGSLTDDGVNV